MKTEAFLVKFTNKGEGKEILCVVGDIYETLSYRFMLGESEYKDIDDSILEEGWTCEKKAIEVSW